MHQEMTPAQVDRINVLETSPIGIMTIDAAGRITFANARAIKILGLTKDEISNRAYSASDWHPTDIAGDPFPDDGLPFQRVMATRQSVYDVQIAIARPDGRRVSLSINGAPMLNGSGDIESVVLTIHDITERSQTEKAHLTNLRFFESMDRVNRAMQGVNDLDKVLSDVLEEMLSIFDCERAWLCYPCDPEADSWRVPMERTRPEFPGALEMKAEVPMDPDVATVFRTMRAASGPVTFGPGSDEPLVGDVPERFQEKSQIAMTVYPKVDKPWLIGMHQCSYPRVWAKDEKILFQEIGRRMGDTLTTLLMYRDLRKSEAENRAIVNAVPDLLFRVRKDGIITDFSKPEEMEIYFPADQFLGRAIIDVLPSDVTQTATAAIERALNTKEVANFEYDLVMMNRQRRYFESRVVALSKEEVLIVDRDITEQKQAERSLQESEAKSHSILDNISIGVALISPDMEILELNRRMRQWFPTVDPGQRPICYRSFNDPPREQMCDSCPTCKTLQDGLVHEATMQMPLAGGISSYRVVSSPILNTSGQVTAAVEMVEDITEKLSLESQLRHAQKMESIGRLAGGLAHDFNNMLGVIIGHTELALSQMTPSQPLKSAMQEIQKAAYRSADLTRQLLAFARKQTIAPRTLDLNQIVEGMLNMLRRLIGEDIDLVWLPDSDLWPVKMDPSQIDQILANLCVNARDAIAGVGKVTIETHMATFDESYCVRHSGYLPGDFILLAVSDNGKGMDKETLDKAFEPFFTTKGIGRGTGLGLATVYGVVKQNDGFINVHSQPGQGTMFRIYLPRCAAERNHLQKEQLAAPVPQGHETVLLVEDEEAIMQMTRLTLESLGYRVLAASTPDEAFAATEKYAGEIKLLITDVVMPNMSGRDLAQELIALYPGFKILFMSGYPSNIIAHHGVLDDGINFIQKPFSIQALAAKVREALDGEQ